MPSRANIVDQSPVDTPELFVASKKKFEYLRERSNENHEYFENAYAVSGGRLHAIADPLMEYTRLICLI